MIWLLEIGLALLLIGGGLKLFSGRGKRDDRESLTMRRVDAYIETIRRERSNPELCAMSDTELRDVLHAGARNFRVMSEKKTWVLLGTGVLTLLCASVIADQDGVRGFVVTLGIGALILYGLNEFLTRRMREPLERRGIDVERLLVQ